MACARVPLDEQQVTEPGPMGKEHTLPALVSHHLIYTNTHSKSRLWWSGIPWRAAHKKNSFIRYKQTLCFLFTVSTRSGRRSAVLCLTSPRQKTALPLRWRSFWNMPNSSQRTWSGCSHCPMTSSGVRWGTANISMSNISLPVHLITNLPGSWQNVSSRYIQFQIQNVLPPSLPPLLWSLSSIRWYLMSLCRGA